MKPEAYMRGTSRVCYLYRDAGNYKFYGEFFVGGKLTLEELRPYLLNHQYFIPQKIGIPSLVPEIQNDDDHVLHEFDSIEPCSSSVYEISAAMLLSRIKLASCRGWFYGF